MAFFVLRWPYSSATARRLPTAGRPSPMCGGAGAMWTPRQSLSSRVRCAAMRPVYAGMSTASVSGEVVALLSPASVEWRAGGERQPSFCSAVRQHRPGDRRPVPDRVALAAARMRVSRALRASSPISARLPRSGERRGRQWPGARGKRVICSSSFCRDSRLPRMPASLTTFFWHRHSQGAGCPARWPRSRPHRLAGRCAPACTLCNCSGPCHYAQAPLLGIRCRRNWL